ncbi:MAG: GvpL/GvpF family gas vesicle protein [Rhodobacteraceae bacterium]|jgi:hypothetical protein|nr:GvpL/GvpF family gas vesicle protein [Paracoccaceae bacterium]
MTGWYLHGVARGDAAALRAALADEPGATGQPEVAELGAYLVIHAPAPEGEVPATRRRMLGHARVLERAMAAADVLPMRFGHVARDPGLLDAVLRDAAGDIDAEFARLSGRCEIGVRLSVPREAALSALLRAAPDLQQRAVAARRAGLTGQIDFGRHVAEALDRARQAAQRRLVDRLRPHVADVQPGTPDTDVQLLRAEFLVDRTAEAAFAEAVQAAARDEADRIGCDPELRLVGPSPAYHFIRLALVAPGLGKAA